MLKTRLGPVLAGVLASLGACDEAADPEWRCGDALQTWVRAPEGSVRDGGLVAAAAGRARQARAGDAATSGSGGPQRRSFVDEHAAGGRASERATAVGDPQGHLVVAGRELQGPGRR